MHADGPHRGSFANAMSRADGRHAAPRAQSTAPTRDDPAAASPPAGGAGATGGKGGGKKAANPGGDDSPPDGSALPLVDAQLAAAANLPLPASPQSAAPLTSTAAAARIDGTLAAAAASASPTGTGVSAEATASPAAAAPPADPSPAQSSPPPASGPVRPPHTVPAAGEFRAVTDRAAPAVAPAPPVPGAAPPQAVVPPSSTPLVAAIVPPAPKPVSMTDEFSMKTTPWTSTPAGTDGTAVATEGARALAPVFPTDTGNGANTEHGSTLADGKPDANAVVSAALAPPTPPSIPASPVVAQVATPVGSPDWPQQLGDRVAVLINQNLTNAQIKLSPAHLGPLEIRIAISDGQANIAFTSHSQVTREALEAAAPKLREMLSGQGFTNVNVDVSQQQFRDRTPQAAHYEPEFSFAAGATAVAASSGTPTTARAIASSLRLDAYA